MVVRVPLETAHNFAQPVTIVRLVLEDLSPALLVPTLLKLAAIKNPSVFPATKVTTVQTQLRVLPHPCSACKVSTAQLVALCRTPTCAHLVTSVPLVALQRLLVQMKIDTRTSMVLINARIAQSATTAQTPLPLSVLLKTKERATTAQVD